MSRLKSLHFKIVEKLKDLWFSLVYDVKKCKTRREVGDEFKFVFKMSNPFQRDLIPNFIYRPKEFKDKCGVCVTFSDLISCELITDPMIQVDLKTCRKHFFGSQDGLIEWISWVISHEYLHLAIRRSEMVVNNPHEETIVKKLYPAEFLSEISKELL